MTPYERRAVQAVHRLEESGAPFWRIRDALRTVQRVVHHRIFNDLVRAAWREGKGQSINNGGSTK
ncbi:MAG: hypothetical protein H3C30_16235 [Candidatus Hydrogenedentes bacterium]|nr:hypothetical protein [Candidatus Hydrogenedentota bacterium]